MTHHEQQPFRLVLYTFFVMYFKFNIKYPITRDILSIFVAPFCIICPCPYSWSFYIRYNHWNIPVDHVEMKTSLIITLWTVDWCVLYNFHFYAIVLLFYRFIGIFMGHLQYGHSESRVSKLCFTFADVCIQLSKHLWWNDWPQRFSLHTWN